MEQTAFMQWWDGYKYLTFSEASDIYSEVAQLRDKNRAMMYLLERWYSWHARTACALVPDWEYDMVTKTADTIKDGDDL